MSEENQQKTTEIPLPERCLALHETEARRLRRWCMRLTWPNDRLHKELGVRAYDRSVRAILRRAPSFEAAIFTEGFRRLVGDQLVSKPSQLSVWATIAWVAAGLKEESPGISLGECMGKQKENSGLPQVSELRLQRLLSANTPEEFALNLRRLLDVVGNKGVSVVSLGDHIKLWWQQYYGEGPERPDRRFSFVLGNDYFKALRAYKNLDD